MFSYLYRKLNLFLIMSVFLASSLLVFSTYGILAKSFKEDYITKNTHFMSQMNKNAIFRLEFIENTVDTSIDKYKFGELLSESKNSEISMRLKSILMYTLEISGFFIIDSNGVSSFSQSLYYNCFNNTPYGSKLLKKLDTHDSCWIYINTNNPSYSKILLYIKSFSVTGRNEKAYLAAHISPERLKNSVCEDSVGLLKNTDMFLKFSDKEYMTVYSNFDINTDKVFFEHENLLSCSETTRGKSITVLSLNNMLHLRKQLRIMFIVFFLIFVLINLLCCLCVSKVTGNITGQLDRLYNSMKTCMEEQNDKNNDS